MQQPSTHFSGTSCKTFLLSVVSSRSASKWKDEKVPIEDPVSVGCMNGFQRLKVVVLRAGSTSRGGSQALGHTPLEEVWGLCLTVWLFFILPWRSSSLGELGAEMWLLFFRIRMPGDWPRFSAREIGNPPLQWPHRAWQKLPLPPGKGCPSLSAAWVTRVVQAPRVGRFQCGEAPRFSVLCDGSVHQSRR